MATPGSTRGYRTLCAVGRGSFGEALLVRSSEGLVRVIKAVNVGRMNKQEQEEAANEVAVFSSLRHPYVIRFHESFVEDGTLAIVMDFAEGGDLYRSIRRTREASRHFPEQQILKWFTEATLGAKYLHSLRLVHRDLKSENCFLSHEATLVLGDFGLCRELPKDADYLTDHRVVVGTPHYLAPEIFTDGMYSPASDIWGLGCVLYEMAALHVPFQAHTVAALSVKVVQGLLPTMPAAYSAGLAELWSQLLRQDRHQRPAAADVLRRPIIQAEAREMLQAAKATARRARSEGPAAGGRRGMGELPLEQTKLPGWLDEAKPVGDHRAASLGAADDGISALGDAAVDVGLPGYPRRDEAVAPSPHATGLLPTAAVDWPSIRPGGIEEAVTLKLSDLTYSVSTKLHENRASWTFCFEQALNEVIVPGDSGAGERSPQPIARPPQVELPPEAAVEVPEGPGFSSDSSERSEKEAPREAKPRLKARVQCPRLQLPAKPAPAEPPRTPSRSRMTRSRTVSRLCGDVLRAQEMLCQEAGALVAETPKPQPARPVPPRLWLPTGPCRAWEEAWPSSRERSTPRVGACTPRGCTPRGCTPRGCTPRGCTPRGCTPRGLGRLQRSKSAACLKENVDPQLQQPLQVVAKARKSSAKGPPNKEPAAAPESARGSARGKVARSGSAPSLARPATPSQGLHALLKGKKLPLPMGGLHADAAPLSVREHGRPPPTNIDNVPRSSRPTKAPAAGPGELRRVASAAGCRRRSA